MVWATVSSVSCFCKLYRASSSLATNNLISLISVLTIWWCPCVEHTLVLLEESVCYDNCILLAELYEPFPCFIVYSKAKFACYSRCFLTSYFCILVQILKDDAVKVLHSVCQQIWKTQQWPQDWKKSVFIPIPQKAMPKNTQAIVQLHSSHTIVK